MRIVVSGPVGSGKTSLATALSARLGVPVLAEDMLLLHRASVAYQQAMASQDGRAEKLAQCRRAWKQAFFDWTAKRQEAYNTYPAFVADRWEADLLSLWLRLFINDKEDAQTLALLQDMRHKASRMTLAVNLPMTQSVQASHNDDGLPRVLSLNVRLSASLLTSALLRECPALRILQIPPAPLTVVQRVDMILAAL